MRYIILTYLAWLASFFAVRAQGTAPKATGTPLRLIATAAASYNPANLQDTTFLTYSNGRGDSNGVGRPHYDVMVHQQRATASSPWQLADRTLQSFDAGNRLVAALTQAWDAAGSQWTADKRTVWGYDAGGRVAGDTASKWVGAVWEPQVANAYTWNGAGQITFSMKSLWNANTSAWDPESRCWYYYNTDGKDSSIIHQVWDVQTNGWLNTERTRYHYDATGRVALEEHDTWNPSPAGWEQGYLWHRGYTATGKPADETLFSWNNNWDTLMRKEWQWNGAEDTAKVRYDAWAPSGRMRVSNDTYGYGADGALACRIVTAWDALSNAYRTLKRELYAYNPQRRQTELRTETWNAGSWLVTPADYWNRFHYETFGQPTGIRAAMAGPDLRVYPVPARESLTVAAGELRSDGVVLIHDAGGRLVQQQPVAAGADVRITVQVGALPAGTYTLTLYGREGRAVKVFSVAR